MSGVASLCTPCVIKFQVLLKQSLQCMYLRFVIKKKGNIERGREGERQIKIEEEVEGCGPEWYISTISHA